jgi:hypothetical protein
VIIENKVWTTEHSDQLDRYYRFVSGNNPGWRVLGIYLTPFGDAPTHEKYLPLDYAAVCKILDNILEDQSLILSLDVRMSIEHYVQMVRRNIVGDSEVARLCQQIYQKHKRALDLIYEYRPDIQSELVDVLEGLIRSNHRMERDSGGKRIIRFVVRDWDKPALLTSSGWTRSGRILMFEFWNNPNNLTLGLVIGPGPDETRKRLFNMVSGSSDVLENPRKLGGAWYAIYLREFLDGAMYEEGFVRERQQEIRRQWAGFLEEDLPRIEEAFKGEKWIWEPTETEGSA